MSDVLDDLLTEEEFVRVPPEDLRMDEISIINMAQTVAEYTIADIPPYATPAQCKVLIENDIATLRMTLEVMSLVLERKKPGLSLVH